MKIYPYAGSPDCHARERLYPKALNECVARGRWGADHVREPAPSAGPDAGFPSQLARAFAREETTIVTKLYIMYNLPVKESFHAQPKTHPIS